VRSARSASGTNIYVRRGTHRDKYDLAAADLTPAAYKRFLEQQPT